MPVNDLREELVHSRTLSLNQELSILNAAAARTQTALGEAEQGKYHQELIDRNKELATSLARTGIQFRETELLGRLPNDIDDFIENTTGSRQTIETVEQVTEFLTNLGQMLINTVEDIFNISVSDQSDPEYKPSTEAIAISEQVNHKGLDIEPGLNLSVVGETDGTAGPLNIQLRLAGIGNIILSRANYHRSIFGDSKYKLSLEGNARTANLELLNPAAVPEQNWQAEAKDQGQTSMPTACIAYDDVNNYPERKFYSWNLSADRLNAPDSLRSCGKTLDRFFIATQQARNAT
ncbi:MAG: hypothetical protein OXU45_08515 [Candidatus Melainabacteria bacterium]|nr:hypothetical protein [Candidatus Melainabacteria bacterium]